MSRLKVLSEGEGHAVYQNEFGPTSMMELLTMTTQKFEEINKRFDGIVKHCKS